MLVERASSVSSRARSAFSRETSARREFSVERVFRRLPVGEAWHPLIGAVVWASLGLLVPRALGVGYGFVDSWGVTQARFEVFTLGTLAVVIAFGIIGYFFGAPVRNETDHRPLEAQPEVMP